MRFREYFCRGETMKCPRCGNLQKSYFYKGSHGYYCRKCIRFGRLLLEEEETSLELQAIQEDCSEYTMQYPLTKFQEAVSKECQMNIRTQDVLLECVCGAGKTEMVLASIADALNENRKSLFCDCKKTSCIRTIRKTEDLFQESKNHRSMWWSYG